jgi:hypothetical protein
LRGLTTAAEFTRKALHSRNLNESEDLVWQANAHTEVAIGNARMLYEGNAHRLSERRSTKTSSSKQLSNEINVQTRLEKAGTLLHFAVECMNSDRGKEGLQRAREARDLLNEILLQLETRKR